MRRRRLDLHVRLNIMRRDGHRCRRCGAGRREAPLEIDHIVPVIFGGSDDDWNLQTLCRPCNRKKGVNDR